jgi:hypothetical protein
LLQVWKAAVQQNEYLMTTWKNLIRENNFNLDIERKWHKDGMSGALKFTKKTGDYFQSNI